MAYVSNTDPYIKAARERGGTTGGASAPSSSTSSQSNTTAYVSSTDPYIKRARETEAVRQAAVNSTSDPLMAAASKPAVTTPDVKSETKVATPNMNINAFGAGDTSGGARLLGNVLGAAGTGVAASALETAGQLTQPQGLTIGENARLAAQGKATQADIVAAEQEKADRIRETIKDPLYAASDKVRGVSEQLTENAKEGLDGVGRTIVDLGITGTQFLGDMALSAINPVLGTASLATRVFGGSAQEARQAGASENRQQIYGVASAATSVVIEKISQVGNAFKRAYGDVLGKGRIDKVIAKLTSKVAKNPALQKLLSSAIGEAGEEGLEAILQPALQAIYDKGATLNKTWFTDDMEEAEDYLTEIGYNALLGGTLGLVAGGGNANAALQTTTANAPTPNAPASRVDADATTDTPTVQNGVESVTEANTPTASKQAQFEVIQQSNPANDDYHTWIRSADDIKTFSEALAEDDSFTPDYTPEMAEQAARDGEVTVYSSKPIANGAFVTPSRMEAQNYAGGGEVYSARVKVDDVAWVDSLQGMMAAVTQSDVNAAVETEVTTDPLMQAARQSAEQPTTDSVGAAKHGYDVWSAAEIDYGMLPDSDKAVRPDDVPVSFDGKTRVSQSVVSAKGSPLTSDGFVPILESAAIQGDYSYAKLSNNETVERAKKHIQKTGSREAALADWIATVSKKGMNAERAAAAMLIYNDALYHGEFAKARKVFTEYQRLERDNARALQIARLWHDMSPQNQLETLFEQMDNLSEELAANNRAPVGANVPVNEWMDKVGEGLAEHLEQAGNLPTETVKSVTQTILADLKHFYNKDIDDKGTRKSKKGRTEFDRLRDMLDNFGNYLEALEATKAKLASDLKDYPEAIAAFNEWIYDLPRYGKRLARELVKEQSVTISDAAAEAFLRANTPAERDAALDVIAEEVAAQIPTSAVDMLTTLRYTNMLLNLKTTGRNVYGNVGMLASSRVKNAISASLQKLMPSLEKRRSVTVGKEYLDVGRAEFEKNKRTVMSQGKYTDATIGSADDFSARVNEIRNRANNTGNKAVDTLLTPLRKANEATQKLLNNPKFGDEAFLRNHYAFALGGYLKAQGITPAQWNDPNWQAEHTELADKIRGFAATEAQENTFRDRNDFSDWVASIGRGNSNMPSIIRIITEGLAPFRRTTANVAKAGFDYSPLGLIGTATNAGRKAIADAEVSNQFLSELQNIVGKKDVTANEIVDQLAKGLTGTGLAALGFALSKLGALRGGGDDDENQAAFDDLVGHQPYSIEVGGHSLTLDWLSPVSMPLFMGAALHELSADEGMSTKTVGEALLTVTDPMIEMSMLSGLKDALDSVRYADSNILQFALEAGLSWLFQHMYSTAGGQIERTFEKNRMTTYVDKNKNTPDWLQYILGRNSAKGIGEYGQIEYIDAWGNTESNGSVVGRAFENFISPAYHSKIEMNPVEEELQRLYDATGASVFPSRAGKKIGDVDLTAEQYTTYATTRGQTMYSLMESVMNNSKYKSLSDEHKAEVMSDLKAYANAVGAKATLPDYAPSSTAKSMVEAEKNGVSPEEYALYVAYRDIVDKPSKNGNYGSYTKAEKEEAANRAGITGRGFDYITK